jgi:ABC-type Na+ transport system ATPase subunit NatA
MNKIKKFILEVQDLDFYHNELDKAHIGLLSIMTTEKNIEFFSDEFNLIHENLNKAISELEKVCIIKRQTLGDLKENGITE